jgi:hypothetical protein
MGDLAKAKGAPTLTQSVDEHGVVLISGAWRRLSITAEEP